MQIISGREDFSLDGPCAVAIGKFDGLHRGHKKLLSRILDQKKNGLLSTVFTFDPSPAAFFSPKPVRMLSTREEKRRYFRQMGVDVLLEFPLNERTAAMLPRRFIQEILCKRLHTAFVAAGEDLSFGDGGRGDLGLLCSCQQSGGYRVDVVDKVLEGGAPISSTRVREAVSQGRMQEAAQLLGEPYTIMGRVVHGRQLGRRLGFPTVNLTPPKDKLLPPYGVYLSETECRWGVFLGLTNIGVRPTVEDGRFFASAETYLYDFDRELYDSFLTVRLLSFLRPEQKFPSLEALKEQVARDLEAGRRERQ